jgi:pimeloyl-ACP methyl ester carboxylesterase
MPQQRVGDIDLYYELVDYCEPWAHDRTPVLFVHGLGGSHAMWLYQVPAFCSRFPVLAVDLRNHGASTKVDDDFAIADMASDVARLLRALGVGSAHVVGLSLGGMVALQLALDHATCVAGLVLADTMAGLPPGFEQMGREALDFIENKPMAEVARARITNAFSPHINPDVRDYFIQQVAQNEKAAYVRAARAAFRFQARERLRDVRRPTLVVIGEEDVVTPAPLSEELAAGIAGAHLLRLRGAGHITNVERPNEFNAAVREFCESIGGQ